MKSTVGKERTVYFCVICLPVFINICFSLHFVLKKAFKKRKSTSLDVIQANKEEINLSNCSACDESEVCLV